MAVEVYNIGEDIPFTTNKSPLRLFGIAVALDGSAHWKVVDSYSSASFPQRYMGNPVTAGYWTSTGDVTNDNSWIVIEQINPRDGYPPMQMKIQCLHSGIYADVSGPGYAHEGDSGSRDLYLRFSPMGDWDFGGVNPDFADPTKASNNRKIAAGHDGSGNSHRDFLVVLQDILFWVSWNINAETMANIVAYIGEYRPKTDGQDTPSNPASMILCNDNGVRTLPKNRTANCFLKEQAGSNTIVGCLDENGVWRDWDYICSAMYDWLPGETQPNEFDELDSPAMDMFEILIRGVGATGVPVGYDDRIIGSLKHVFRGDGLGAGVQFANRAWCCAEAGYSCFFPWDGSTSMV